MIIRTIGIIAEIVEWSQNSSRVSNLAFKNDGKDETALIIPYCKNFGVGWGQYSKIAGTPGRSAWSVRFKYYVTTV